MQNEMITLRNGAKIFTAFSKGKDAETMIYIHGGPGNGIWDVMPLLSELENEFNVIAFDERGVNRSDPIGEGFCSEMLIDDIDEVRRIFGIEKPVLMGHSYGGHLLLRYALKYPEHTGKCIFICPSFDILDSLQMVVIQALGLMKGRDLPEIVTMQKAITDPSFETIFTALASIPEDIQNIVYGYDRIPAAMAEKVGREAPTEEMMKRSSEHQQAVFSEEEQNGDKTHLLSGLMCPSLLIVGRADSVCTNRQKDIFRTSVKYGETVILENSGHFPYLDALDETVRVITGFANR